jgi:hypothetical protein
LGTSQSEGEEVEEIKEDQLKPEAGRTVLSDPNPATMIQATLKLITEPRFAMDIQIESKLKHLIDTYSKILYMNRSQLPLVNYNFADAYRIVDSLAGFLCSVRYFDKQIMQESLETIELVPRLE